MLCSIPNEEGRNVLGYEPYCNLSTDTDFVIDLRICFTASTGLCRVELPEVRPFPDENQTPSDVARSHRRRFDNALNSKLLLTRQSVILGPVVDRVGENVSVNSGISL